MWVEPTRKGLTNHAIHFYYDKSGRLVEVFDGNDKFELSYDALGRNARQKISLAGLKEKITFDHGFGVMGHRTSQLLLIGNAGSLPTAVGFLILFGIGYGFFDCNNMPLCQIVRLELRATGYGIMNLVGTSSGGFAD